MKIQCDVCDKDEASVFCVADEAALCNSCDHRVHHANKLAGKHQRFSLLQPSAKQVPLCDICQERRAFLFCQQDRAILCRECDIPIHKANEHTQKHNRFLLTGVKLSANSSLYSSSSSSNSASSANSMNNINNNVCDGVPNLQSQSQNSTKRPSNSKIHNNQRSISSTDTSEATNGQMMNVGEGTNSVPTSSISEYLIEMLPGWHVEDFLDPSGFCKSGGGDNDMMALWQGGLESSNPSSLSAESSGIWVPRTTNLHPTQNHIQSFSNSNNMMGFSGQISFKESKDMISNIKSSRKWKEDNSFAVPQINPTSSSKRYRTLW